jgi:cytoskeletal protein RodZ
MASSTAAPSLEQIRKENGVSLRQVADSTKISMLFLQAIENEQFAKLPGGVFNRSYIRQYAAAAGIPEESLLRKYEAYEAERARSEEPCRRTPPRRTFGLRWIASVLIAVTDLLS